MFVSCVIYVVRWDDGFGDRSGRMSVLCFLPRDLRQQWGKRETRKEETLFGAVTATGAITMPRIIMRRTNEEA